MLDGIQAWTDELVHNGPYPRFTIYFQCDFFAKSIYSYHNQQAYRQITIQHYKEQLKKLEVLAIIKLFTLHVHFLAFKYINAVIVY